MSKQEKKNVSKRPKEKTRYLIRIPTKQIWPEGVEDTTNLPNLYESDSANALDLACLLDGGLEDPNTIYPSFPLNYLALILETYEHGLYPPRIVMDWLTQGLNRYVKAGGKKRLDECLELIGKRGQQDLLGTYKRMMRDKRLCRHMAACRTWWRVSIEQAAIMVASLPDTLSQDTLESRFKRDKIWKIWRNPGVYVARPFSELGEPRAVLNKFSYDSLPPELQPKHRSHP